MTEHSPTDAPLDPGIYIVATPIGNARDITLRALDVLANADVLAAEDTRTLRKLMSIHGIGLGDRPIIAYHDHNADRLTESLLAHVAAGRSVALTSDAGTPLIADPGYTVVARAREAGVAVTTAPGASAVVSALSICGLPTDRFSFAGFPPPKSAARRAFFLQVDTPHTVFVFYESPKRVKASIADMAAVFGPDRRLVIARELTKKFEQVVAVPLGNAADRIDVDIPAKGEFVLLLDKAVPLVASDADIQAYLEDQLKDLHLKDAATRAAEKFGISRKDAYGRALKVKEP